MKSQSPLRNRVKELRARLGVRQADLAHEVGITRQTIIAIEKGRLNPSVLICLKIARLLREPVDYIFYLAPGWEKAGDLDGVVEEEQAPKPNSTRVRVASKPRKKIEEEPVEEVEETPEEEETSQEVPVDRYGLDRDAGADALDETGDEEVPESVAASMDEPGEALEPEMPNQPEPEPEVSGFGTAHPQEETPPTGVEKQGQAIWDFF
ncbi:MAG: helix-turn-helix transcriptional regulator [Candidatus Hydrogenedentes bacterium]|nr:helix-turn-helix transcriptional regulator [Candidatus Hydrogenedentota bacterium]